MPATQADTLAKGDVWLSIDSTSRSSGDYMEPQQVAAWQQARKGRPPCRARRCG